MEMEILFYLLQFFQIFDVSYADSGDDNNIDDMVKLKPSLTVKKVVITFVIIALIIVMIYYRPQDPGSGPVLDLAKIEELNLRLGDIEISENIEKYYENKMLREAIEKIKKQDNNNFSTQDNNNFSTQDNNNFSELEEL